MHIEYQTKLLRGNVIYQIRHRNRIQKNWILLLDDSKVSSSPICASVTQLVMQESNFLCIPNLSVAACKTFRV